MNTLKMWSCVIAPLFIYVFVNLCAKDSIYVLARQNEPTASSSSGTKTVLAVKRLPLRDYISAELKVDDLPKCKADPKPVRRVLPAQTDYWKAQIEELPDGLMVFKSDTGGIYINVGVFGEELMSLTKTSPMNNRQKASLAWLESNKEPLGESAVVWRSNYATNYKDLLFEPRWSGGYAQASIIGGLMKLYEITQEKQWLSLAIQAGLSYGVSTTQGGFGERLPNGCLWFEELTSPTIAKAGLSPHICNGHIWATLHLTRLARLSGDERITQLAREGELSLKAMMPMFDNGSWIRYDLSPNRYDLRFCLQYWSDVPPAKGDGLVGPRICMIQLQQCGTDDNAIQLCIGEEGDDEGAWRIINGSYGDDFGVVPWCERQSHADRSCRSIVPGKSVFIMELPVGAEVDYFKEPYLRLQIYYFDIGAPGILDARVFSFREQVNNEYADLPGGAHRLLGDGRLRLLEKSVRLSDLAKSSLTSWKISVAYIKPLKELEAITGDTFYTLWRIRLQAQVDALKSQYPDLIFGNR